MLRNKSPSQSFDEEKLEAAEAALRPGSEVTLRHTVADYAVASLAVALLAALVEL